MQFGTPILCANCASKNYIQQAAELAADQAADYDYDGDED